MKVFSLATTIALLATSALAAPAVKAARQSDVQVTYHGATPDDTVVQYVRTDGSTFTVGT